MAQSLRARLLLAQEKSAMHAMGSKQKETDCVREGVLYHRYVFPRFFFWCRKKKDVVKNLNAHLAHLANAAGRLIRAGRPRAVRPSRNLQ